ncbi:hypothetical protein MVEN_02334000 [Mycena venus]|uniref:Small secreted protein n=1 Tax=Mycena venus TaxID=2733690 RepID=A0A8H6X3P9_9AGAR|nr:hypothetical protein MVEN_02334000 [Mycena venus]
MFSKVSRVLVLAAVAANLAGAAVLKERFTAPVTICENIDSPQQCVTLPVNADTCIDLTGGLDPWNNAISIVDVPQGFACSFFDQFDCVSNGNNDVVFLQTGETNMFNAEGFQGPQNFNDLASSFTCAAVW